MVLLSGKHHIKKMTLHNLKLFTEQLREKEHIYIYGAGKKSMMLQTYLENNEIEINGYVVTDLKKNPSQVQGKKVYSINEYNDNKGIIIVPFFQGEYYREIFDYLSEKRICNVFFLPKNFLLEIEHINIVSVLEQRGLKVVEDESLESGHYLILENKGKAFLGRILQRNLIQIINCNDQQFFEQSLLQKCEKQYGLYTDLKKIPEHNNNEKSVAIYMAQSHVDKVRLAGGKSAEWIIPIQVGASLTEERICELQDCDGENISDRNGIYSECTAIYWMWKNAPKTDYIGLCHYRRHIDVDRQTFSSMCAEDIDVLVTRPTILIESVADFLTVFISKTDFDVMRKAIRKVQPEYSDVTERFLASECYPPCNLFLMKYDLFQQYAEFVFSITFEIERFYEELKFYRNDRYMGFLVECLLGIFLMKHKDELKIAYTDMIFYQ